MDTLVLILTTLWYLSLTTLVTLNGATASMVISGYYHPKLITPCFVFALLNTLYVIAMIYGIYLSPGVGFNMLHTVMFVESTAVSLVLGFSFKKYVILKA